LSVIEISDDKGVQIGLKLNGIVAIIAAFTAQNPTALCLRLWTGWPLSGLVGGIMSKHYGFSLFIPILLTDEKATIETSSLNIKETLRTYFRYERASLSDYRQVL
jgi:uncharacterized membrane protein YraQ (UPF0718 family)